ncbi:TPA: hypothetical protein ACISXX_004759 [Salmonella enterica subsp. diarizonae serovar 61:l,v:z35]
MSDVNLTYDEIFGYLMKKSGRWLPGAPKIDLPYPLPAQSVGKINYGPKNTFIV